MRILIIPILYVLFLANLGKHRKLQDPLQGQDHGKSLVFTSQPHYTVIAIYEKTQVRYQNHARFPTPKTYKSEESLGNWEKFLQHFERSMAPSKVWSFMFASVLLMLVAACYSEDTEDAIQEPMPGEWVVISPRVLVLSLMTIWQNLPKFPLINAKFLIIILKNILLTNVSQINFSCDGYFAN